jgi:prephenate dehydrogenase
VKKFEQLGLIGCGMMGGSFALAAKRVGLVKRVVGYSKSPSKTEKAKQSGVIDIAVGSALQAMVGSDLVLIAVPVSATADIFKAIQFGFNKHALVMDVGSTKADVVRSVIKIFGEMPPNFIPAHPIAGKERGGIEEADVDLYKGLRVILTPTEQTDTESLKLAELVWQALGMKVAHMSAKEHDQIFAAVSHMPHLLAFAYMNSVIGQPKSQTFLEMAGPGFRDFTRIAAGDPEVWRDIFLANRNEILKQSGSMLHSLSQLEYAIRQGDTTGLKDMITNASRVRDAWQLQSLAKKSDA